MWNHFEFANGARPYITTANKTFFDMIFHYNVSQIGDHFFRVESEWTPRKKTYAECKEAVREFAKEWQYKFGDCNYSWGDLAEWGDFFEEYGKRYGLMREFHENAIV